MKPPLRSTIDEVSLGLLQKGLVLGTVLGSFVFAALLYSIADGLKAVEIIGGVVCLGGLGTAYFVIPLAIEKMRNDPGLFLRHAIKEALVSYVMLMSFVPVVGPVFARLLPAQKKRNPFVSKTSDD